MALLRTKVSVNEVLGAIEGSCGTLEPIERKLKCTRKALKEIIAANPEIDEALRDEREREKDKVICNMIADAKAGDPKARELFLKAEARDRGYGDRLEVTGKDGQPLVCLHAVATNLTANESNNFATKNQRIASWGKQAVEYHEKQKSLVDNAMGANVPNKRGRQNK